MNNPFMGRQLNGNKFVLHYKCHQTDFRKAQFKGSLKCENIKINSLKIVLKWLIQIGETKPLKFKWPIFTYYFTYKTKC